MCVCVYACVFVLCSVASVMSVSATLWTVVCQAPLSMGYSRQEYWSGLPCPPPRDLLNPGIELRSPALQADSLPSEPPGKPQEILIITYSHNSGLGSNLSSSKKLTPDHRRLNCISTLPAILKSNLSPFPILHGTFINIFWELGRKGSGL